MTDKNLPPLPTLNVDLLSNVVMWAYADDQELTDMLNEKFPDWGSWNQGMWVREKRNGVCQTAFCIAGQTVSQVGYKMNLSLSDTETHAYNYETQEFEELDHQINTYEAFWCHPVKKNGKDEKGNQRYKRTGDDISISHAAAKALGLTYSEAALLFGADNEIDQIVWYASEFARVRGTNLNLSDEVAALGAKWAEGEDPIEDIVWDYDEYLV